MRSQVIDLAIDQWNSCYYFALEVIAILKYARKTDWTNIVTKISIDAQASVIKNIVQNEKDKK
ncbi:MAG: hypothetical protein M3352_08070 [Bacteroidota bacterium]|nr:hypothetical protein [Bacteroidota bacterium]